MSEKFLAAWRKLRENRTTTHVNALMVLASSNQVVADACRDFFQAADDLADAMAAFGSLHPRWVEARCDGCRASLGFVFTAPVSRDAPALCNACAADPKKRKEHEK